MLFPASERTLPSQAPPGEESPRDPSRTGTILVVDDQEQVLDVATKVLERAGHTVLRAKDGREAVRVFRERAQEITAVLLDLTMTGMSGEETFDRIRSIRPDARVILSSGFSEQEATLRFEGKGLLGFLQKPYRQSALLEKLREVTED